MKKLLSFLKEEDGVTAIEYGLIAAAIGVAVAVIAGTVGTSLVAKFQEIDDKLQ